MNNMNIKDVAALGGKARWKNTTKKERQKIMVKLAKKPRPGRRKSTIDGSEQAR